MYWLIEDPKHIELLASLKHDVAYVEVIPNSHNLHAVENDVCALYIRPKNDSKGYIIPVNHSETINATIEDCLKVLNSIQHIYVRDRKEFLHYFTLKHCTQPSPSPNTYIPQLTTAHTQLYNRYPEIQNLNTLTTRPSNTFNNINFSALHKFNGERKFIIPRNDSFIEMDISAYHPTLLANLLDYTFDSFDIHGSFATMYNVDYAKAKEITFKQLYGGVWKEYQGLKFFQKVIAYTDDLWETFNYGGHIKCPISDYKFYNNELENMNPQKLLNYVLQNLETATNVNILYEIFKVLRGKNTKLVLYVYDSFLFDYDKNEPDVILKILGIFNKYKLQVKTKKGKNYNDIK